MIRLLRVDDRPLLCYGLKVFLEGEPDLHVVGEADSEQSAIERVETLQPDC